MASGPATQPHMDAAGGAQASAPGAASTNPREALIPKLPHSMRVLDSQMPADLEADALLVSAAAVERHRQHKDVAAFIKKEMQRLHPGGNRVRHARLRGTCGRATLRQQHAS